MSTTLWDAAYRAVEQLVEDMACKNPGRPAPGIEHCAACCMGTGFDVTTFEELVVAQAAKGLLDAMKEAES